MPDSMFHENIGQRIIFFQCFHVYLCGNTSASLRMEKVESVDISRRGTIVLNNGLRQKGLISIYQNLKSKRCQEIS